MKQIKQTEKMYIDFLSVIATFSVSTWIDYIGVNTPI